ncbi:SDR family oxidoreductase [Streptomyces sp. NPDC058375]|uniref:SDR family oxidoreductase n=1 Tax=Streptomyces sp. NPDC058375 TaxID=3346467 RepID=UPI003655743A
MRFPPARPIGHSAGYLGWRGDHPSTLRPARRGRAARQPDLRPRHDAVGRGADDAAGPRGPDHPLRRHAVQRPGTEHRAVQSGRSLPARVYDWMGPVKAALESTNRYLARDLGPKRIRVNAVDSGPITTMAGKSIPGFESLAEAWPKRAPLGWDTSDASPVADTVSFLLGDDSRAITGQVLHVDGGFSSVGV